jgi:hypothetical protein
VVHERSSFPCLRAGCEATALGFDYDGVDDSGFLWECAAGHFGPRVAQD